MTRDLQLSPDLAHQMIPELQKQIDWIMSRLLQFAADEDMVAFAKFYSMLCHMKNELEIMERIVNISTPQLSDQKRP